MKIVKTSEAGHEHGLKILVHGPAGSGKTRLAATTGDLEHTLILSAEAGLLSLRGEDIDAVNVTSIGSLREALVYIKRGLRGEKLEDGSTPKRYRWVMVDSVSEIAETLLAEGLKTADDPRRAYGEMADAVFKVVRALRDLSGVNVVMTAKQARIQDEGRLIYAPMFPGKQIEANISYLFDEVFAMRMAPGKDGEPVRYLQCVGDGYYEAKDRSGALRVNEPADLARIADKIFATGAVSAPAGDEES